MSRRKINDYMNPLIETFDSLSISTKYKILGSASLSSTLYINDYDLHDYFKSNSSSAFHRITQHFTHLFQKTFDSSNKWIIDFKCGFDDSYPEDDDRYKLRWSREDIKKGYIKLGNGRKKSFHECILDKTTMKIDYVLLLNGQFIEISDNYTIRIQGQSNSSNHSNSSKNIEQELKYEINKYKSEGNLFKALKREFSLLRLTGKNQKRMQKLTQLFNSEAGYTNKIINELKLIKIMCDQTFRPVKKKDVEMNLQIIKQQLSSVYLIHLRSFSSIIDKLCKESVDTIGASLNLMIDYIEDQLNKYIKK
jgi:hypothetical protein